MGCLAAWASLLVLALAPLAALAETFPAKPVRFVVPFVAGGSADVMARVLGQHLAPLWGQSVVIDNRPGSGGHIGAQAVAKAPGDGYTIVLGTIGIHAAYSIYRSLPYDPAKELQPVTLLAEFPNILIIHPSLPANNVAEFLTLAKAKPGEINFGSAGMGTSTHMIGEAFMQASGVTLTHVPYKGSAQAMNDLLGGQIQAMFDNLPTTIQHVKTGALRGLAVTSATRSPSLPEVPTADEAGVPGFEATAWFAVSTASTVPPEIVTKLNADINGLLKQPEVLAQFAQLGATPMGGSTAEARRFFDSEVRKWTAVIDRAGIKVD
jgi:tripartite-type tricarboxylate transporter receptor subunit TctC